MTFPSWKEREKIEGCHSSTRKRQGGISKGFELREPEINLLRLMLESIPQREKKGKLTES